MFNVKTNTYVSSSFVHFSLMWVIIGNNKSLTVVLSLNRSFRFVSVRSIPFRAISFRSICSVAFFDNRLMLSFFSYAHKTKFLFRFSLQQCVDDTDTTHNRNNSRRSACDIVVMSTTINSGGIGRRCVISNNINVFRDCFVVSFI